MVLAGIRLGWFRGDPCGLLGQRCPYFFEFVTSFHAVFLQLMPNGGVTFCNLADVAFECFGHHAKMTFDLFHLLGVHRSLV